MAEVLEGVADEEAIVGHDRIFQRKHLIDLSSHDLLSNSSQILSRKAFNDEPGSTLVSLMYTIGRWLRKSALSEEMGETWTLVLTAETVGNAWTLLLHGTLHDEPIVRIFALRACIEGSESFKLNSTVVHLALRVIESLLPQLTLITETDEWENTRILAYRAIQHLCKWIIESHLEYAANKKFPGDHSDEENTSSDVSDSDDDIDVEEAQKSLGMKYLLYQCFLALLTRMAVLFNESRKQQHEGDVATSDRETIYIIYAIGNFIDHNICSSIKSLQKDMPLVFFLFLHHFPVRADERVSFFTQYAVMVVLNENRNGDEDARKLFIDRVQFHLDKILNMLGNRRDGVEKKLEREMIKFRNSSDTPEEEVKEHFQIVSRKQGLQRLKTCLEAAEVDLFDGYARLLKHVESKEKKIIKEIKRKLKLTRMLQRAPGLTAVLTLDADQNDEEISHNVFTTDVEGNRFPLSKHISTTLPASPDAIVTLAMLLPPILGVPRGCTTVPPVLSDKKKRSVTALPKKLRQDHEPSKQQGYNTHASPILLGGLGSALSRGYQPFPAAVDNPIVPELPVEVSVSYTSVLGLPRPIGLGKGGCADDENVPMGFQKTPQHEGFHRYKLVPKVEPWHAAKLKEIYSGPLKHNELGEHDGCSHLALPLVSAYHPNMSHVAASRPHEFQVGSLVEIHIDSDHEGKGIIRYETRVIAVNTAIEMAHEVKKHMSTSLDARKHEVLELGSSIFLRLGDSEDAYVCELRVEECTEEDSEELLTLLAYHLVESQPEPAGCTIEHSEFYAPPVNFSPIPSVYKASPTGKCAPLYGVPESPMPTPIGFLDDGTAFYKSRQVENHEPAGFTNCGLPFFLPKNSWLPKPSGYTRTGVPFYSISHLVQLNLRDKLWAEQEPAIVDLKRKNYVNRELAKTLEIIPDTTEDIEAINNFKDAKNSEQNAMNELEEIEKTLETARAEGDEEKILEAQKQKDAAIDDLRVARSNVEKIKSSSQFQKTIAKKKRQARRKLHLKDQQEANVGNDVGSNNEHNTQLEGGNEGNGDDDQQSTLADDVFVEKMDDEHILDILETNLSKTDSNQSDPDDVDQSVESDDSDDILAEYAHQDHNNTEDENEELQIHVDHEKLSFNEILKEDILVTELMHIKGPEIVDIYFQIESDCFEDDDELQSVFFIESGDYAQLKVGERLQLRIVYRPFQTRKISQELIATIKISYGHKINRVLPQKIRLVAFRGPTLKVDLEVLYGVQTVWSLPASQRVDEEPQYEVVVRNVGTIDGVDFIAVVEEDKQNKLGFSAFSIDAKNFNVEAGDEKKFFVYFFPESEGKYDCVVSISTSMGECHRLHLHGICGIPLLLRSYTCQIMDCHVDIPKHQKSNILKYLENVTFDKQVTPSKLDISRTIRELHRNAAAAESKKKSQEVEDIKSKIETAQKKLDPCIDDCNVARAKYYDQFAIYKEKLQTGAGEHLDHKLLRNTKSDFIAAKKLELIARCDVYVEAQRAEALLNMWVKRTSYDDACEQEREAKVRNDSIEIRVATNKRRRETRIFEESRLHFEELKRRTPEEQLDLFFENDRNSNLVEVEGKDTIDTLENYDEENKEHRDSIPNIEQFAQAETSSQLGYNIAGKIEQSNRFHSQLPFADELIVTFPFQLLETNSRSALTDFIDDIREIDAWPVARVNTNIASPQDLSPVKVKAEINFGVLTPSSSTITRFLELKNCKEHESMIVYLSCSSSMYEFDNHIFLPSNSSRVISIQLKALLHTSESCRQRLDVWCAAGGYQSVSLLYHIGPILEIPINKHIFFAPTLVGHTRKVEVPVINKSSSRVAFCLSICKSGDQNPSAGVTNNFKTSIGDDYASPVFINPYATGMVEVTFDPITVGGHSCEIDVEILLPERATNKTVLLLSGVGVSRDYQDNDYHGLILWSLGRKPLGLPDFLWEGEKSKPSDSSEKMFFASHDGTMLKSGLKLHRHNPPTGLRFVNQKHKAVDFVFVTSPGFKMNEREVSVEAGSTIMLEVAYIGEFERDYEGYICAISKVTPVETSYLPLHGKPEEAKKEVIKVWPPERISFNRCFTNSWRTEELLLWNLTNESVEIKLDFRETDGIFFCIPRMNKFRLGPYSTFTLLIKFEPKAERQVSRQILICTEAVIIPITLVGFGYSNILNGVPDDMKFGRVSTGNQRIYDLEMKNLGLVTQNLTVMLQTPFMVVPTFSNLMAGGRGSSQNFLFSYKPTSHSSTSLAHSEDVKIYMNSTFHHFKVTGSSGRALLQTEGLHNDRLVFGDVPLGATAQARMFFSNDGELPLVMNRLSLKEDISVVFKGIERNELIRGNERQMKLSRPTWKLNRSRNIKRRASSVISGSETSAGETEVIIIQPDKTAYFDVILRPSTEMLFDDSINLNFQIFQENRVRHDMQLQPVVLYDVPKNASEIQKTVQIKAQFHEQVVIQPATDPGNKFDFGVVAPLAEIDMTAAPLIRCITIENPGNMEQKVVIKSWTEQKYFQIPGSTSWVLRPGEKTVVPIHFSPTKHLEEYNSTITIAQEFNNGLCTSHVYLTGLGSLAEVDFDRKTPQKIDFGKVRVGQKISRSLRIVNYGFIESAFEITCTPSVFSVLQPSGFVPARTVNNTAGFADIIVDFHMDDHGADDYLGDLVLWWQKAPVGGKSEMEHGKTWGRHSISMSASKGWSRLELLQEHLDFDMVVIDHTKSREFQIENKGNAPCKWEVVDASRLKVHPSSGTLDGAEKVSVHVAFTPSKVDMLHEFIKIDCDDGRKLKLLASGTVGVPRLTTLPKPGNLSFDFGNVSIGSSTRRSIKLRNIGNLPVSFNIIVEKAKSKKEAGKNIISSMFNAAKRSARFLKNRISRRNEQSRLDDAVTKDDTISCGPFSFAPYCGKLRPAASVEVILTAMPKKEGADDAITFWIDSKETASKIEGEALVGGGFCRLVMSSSHFPTADVKIIDFGLVKVGENKTVENAIEVANLGNMELNYSIFWEGDDEMEAFTLKSSGGVLNGGEKVPIAITFSAPSKGMFKGELYIMHVDNDRLKPLKLRVRGSAAIAKINVSKKMLDFKKVIVGHVLTETVELTNTGGHKGTCKLNIVNALKYASAMDSVFCVTCKHKHYEKEGYVEIVVEPGETIPIDITFKPAVVCRPDQELEQYKYKLQISGDIEDIVGVDLIGKGAEAKLVYAVVPETEIQEGQGEDHLVYGSNTLDFGEHFRRTTHARYICVKNVGNILTNFSSSFDQIDSTIFGGPVWSAHDLDEGEYVLLEVTFTPKVANRYNGHLVLKSPTAGDMEIPLCGTGTNCILRDDVDGVLDFDQIAVEVPTELRFTVNNVGTASCQYSVSIIPETITKFSKTWFHNQYDPENTETVDKTINPGESATVCVEVTPEKNVQEFLGQLIFLPSRPGDVTLKENGLVISVRGCGNATLLRFDINKPIDFGKVKAGEKLCVRRLLMNPADIAVKWELEVEGDLYGWSIEPTEGTLQAADSESLQITFECYEDMDETQVFSFKALIRNLTASHADLRFTGSAQRSYPRFQLTEDSIVDGLDFNIVNTTEDKTLSFHVKNSGTGILKCNLSIVGEVESYKILSDDKYIEIKDDGSEAEIKIVFHPSRDGDLVSTLCISSNDIDRDGEEIMIPLRGLGITYVINETFQRNVQLGHCEIGGLVTKPIHFKNDGPVPYPITFEIDVSTGFTAVPSYISIPGNDEGKVTLQWRAPGFVVDTLPSEDVLAAIVSQLEAGGFQSVVTAHMPLGRIETISVSCTGVMPSIVLTDSMRNKLDSIEFGSVVLNQSTSQSIYVKNQAEFPVRFSVSFTNDSFYVEGSDRGDIIIERKGLKSIVCFCRPKDHPPPDSQEYLILTFMTGFSAIRVPLYVQTREFCLNARLLGPIQYSSCFSKVRVVKTLTLENMSDNPVSFELKKDRIGPYFGIEEEALTGTVSIGGENMFHVYFDAPQINDFHTGFITIVVDDGTESKFTIDISGTSVIPVIEVSPSTLDFQIVGIGHTVTKTVEVRNACDLEMSLSCDLINSDAFVVDPLHLIIGPNASQTVDISFQPSDKHAHSCHFIVEGEDVKNVGGKVHLLGTGGNISLAVENSIDFGEVDARAIPFIKRSVRVYNDGELPVTFSILAEDGSRFEMRKAIHHEGLRSREKRFEECILSLAYSKETLFPSKSTDIDVFIYVVENAIVDMFLLLELSDGSIQWKIKLKAIGKPAEISQDALFLLDDLDKSSSILRPYEIGPDVPFEAIIAQPDRIPKVSIGHILAPVVPYVSRETLAHITSIPPPVHRFVKDTRRAAWHTNRVPVRFNALPDWNNVDNEDWSTTRGSHQN